MLTLGQAARITGKGKTTLVRAIQAGKLSATRRDDGGYSIDPSELSRVYGVTPEGVSTAHREIANHELETRLALAETQLQAMKDMLAEIRQSRDDWKAQAERLALVAPIAAPAAPSPEPQPANQRRPWWRRMAG